MPFLVAEDPDITQFKKLALAIEPYIDILEIGIPFSDPIADGPTIQKANVRAFYNGINTKLAFNFYFGILLKKKKKEILNISSFKLKKCEDYTWNHVS